jgi:serine/threonine protein phosphatase 1
MTDTPVVARFEPNHEGRDFVVGDLHGMYPLLGDLLARAAFDRAKDRLFSVGDLCDRGPHSEQALDYLAEPWFHACLGNHEEMLLSALRGGDLHAVTLWSMNGGDWGLELSPIKQQRFMAAFSKLPLTMEIPHSALGRIAVVHAEVPQGVAWDDFTARLETGDEKLRNHALWARSRISQAGTRKRDEGVSGVVRLFCGHTILREPLLLGNVQYLDTGAFLGASGALSMVELKRGFPLLQASGQ